MSTQSLGTFGWAHRESVIFARRFAAWFAVISLFSLPALAVVVGLVPAALPFLLAGMIAVATSMTGEEIERPEDDDELNMSFRDAITFMVVMYTMFAAGFSVLLLFGVVLGLLVAIEFAAPSAALLIALVVPVADWQIGHRTGYSIFGAVTLFVITVFDLLAAIYRLSGSVREGARRGRRRMIN